MFEVYKKYRSAGLYILPCKQNKTPAVKTWGGKNIDVSHLAPLSEGIINNSPFMCVVCGQVSGGGVELSDIKLNDNGIGVEFLDFDIKNGETYPQWKELVINTLGQEFFDKLYIESSPSKGHHVGYKCAKFEGNLKLASRIATEEEIAAKPKEKIKGMIETRGHGGYIVTSPSTGYLWIQGDLCNLTLITEDQRDCMIGAARSFNKIVKQEVPKKPTTKSSKQAIEGAGVIEDFNERFPIIEYLVSKGWTVAFSKGKVTHFIRPGKTSGAGATFGHHPNQFHVFTSSSDFDVDKSYLPFTVYAILEFNGDKKEAFKGAKKAGYGKQYVFESHTDTGNGITTTIRSVADLAVKENIERIAFEEIKNGIPYSETQVQAWAVGLGAPPEIVRQIFKDAYEVTFKEFFGFNKFTSQRKAKTYMKKKYRLRVNIINNRIEYQSGDDKWVYIEIGDIWNVVGDITDVNYETIRRLCYVSEVSERYDPFEEYLKSLTWNGEDEISKWCKHIKVTQQEYHDKQARKMFVRCCACMIGVYINRFIWAYKGGQNMGKSWALKFLCPPALMEYYTEESPTHEKDGVIRLMENAFYNWEELQSSGLKDIKNIKAMISKSEVKQRRPYGDREERGKRRANFFGSVNDDQFLTDDENTRWLIFSIISIDYSYTKNVNIDNLWAQAYALYQSGFDFVPNKEEMDEQRKHNDEYSVISPDEELLVQNFRKPDEGSENVMRYTAAEIVVKLSEITNRHIKISPVFVGRALKKRGYYNKRSSTTGLTEWWVIPPDDANAPKNGHEKSFEEKKDELKVKKVVAADSGDLPF